VVGGSTDLTERRLGFSNFTREQEWLLAFRPPELQTRKILVEFTVRFYQNKAL
jgi:hypothetical protein